MYTQANSKKYTGQWLNNKMHGQGHMIYSDGNQYIGEFESDQKHGKGKLIWKDGREYDGDWVDGK